jgi:polyisoprenoid-binding protein YceI
MRNILLSSTLIFAAMPALAAPWIVESEPSKLTFEASQSSETITGNFTKFKPEIEFSEAEPEKGKIFVTVDITSLKTENSDAKDALPTAEWLDAKKFPHAEFSSTSIKRTGPHQYQAIGKLTIHGITQEATLPFTLTPEGTKIRAEGEVVINRKTFNIGTGQWASDKWVAYPVKLRYSILASPT